jgi:hypothetical protein
MITFSLLAILNSLSRANPIVIEEAKKYETILTALVIQEDNKKVIVINRIIKGKVDKLTFELVKLQADSKSSKDADEFLFLFSGDRKKIVTSVIGKNDRFGWTIGGKLLKANINEIAE